MAKAVLPAAVGPVMTINIFSGLIVEDVIRYWLYVMGIKSV